MENLQFIPQDSRWLMAGILAIVAGRYFLLAGSAYLLCYRWKLKKFMPYKIQHNAPKPSQLKHEIRFSLSTILIFSFVGMTAVLLYFSGHTTIYLEVSAHGIPYLLLSAAILFFIHDTYFYWTHRLLHTKWMFRKIHAVHHRSVNPTPLAAYSFHPLEAFIESLIIFPFIMIFPVHLFVFGLFIFLVLLTNVIGHLGFEFFSPQLRRSALGKFLASSTHHNLHHQKSKRNFGYYFTIWDRIMDTLYDDLPVKKTNSKPSTPPAVSMPGVKRPRVS
jgi:lathosterol oxidase